MSLKLSSNITEEMQKFILQNYPNMTHEKLAIAFNERFKTNYAHSYLKRKVVPAVYEKNNISLIDAKPSARFKKGHLCKHYKEIGTERWDPNAEAWIIKVSDTSTKKNKGWEQKSRVMYEKYYGEIPEGYVVIFKNFDKNDFSKENLIAIPRNYLRLFGNLESIKDEETRAEILEVILLINKIYDKVREVKEK